MNWTGGRGFPFRRTSTGGALDGIAAAHCARHAWRMKKALFAALCALLASTSALRSQGWVDVTPPGVQAPDMPTSHTSTACYDPVRQVTWLFVQNQIYSWDGTSFAGPIATTLGSVPWASAWDSVNQRVLVLQRVSGPSNIDELIAWDGVSVVVLPAPPFFNVTTTWSRMAFDEASGSALVLSGSGFTTMSVFDGTSWAVATPNALPSLVFGNDSSMFFDDSRGRVAMLVKPTSQYAPQYWEWLGSNWAQHYTTPLPSGLGPVAAAPSRGLSVAVKFDPTQLSPQMFAIADGQFEELFLTSWPAMRQGHKLVYDSGRDRFVLIGGQGFVGGSYRDVWELDLGTTASFTTYGAGCTGSGGVPNLAAQSGSAPAVNTQFSIQVSNLPWTGPCFMWLGFSNQTYGGFPLPVNLAILGAPQCSVLMSPDILYSIPNVLGTSVWTLAIPNVPGFTFYSQAIAFDPVANPLGLVFSNASEAIVGQ